jgi:glycosyltransferase involved in cell wall biosynthesis
MMLISIVIPVYNESKTLREIVRRVQASSLPDDCERELIIIDDCSRDNTREILSSLSDPRIKKFYHEKNLGKGAALRTGFKNCSGDVIIIQDADLEYDPSEYIKLLSPILKVKADVVFGSRFIGNEPHRVIYFWHCVANSVLTFFSNMLSDLNLTDIETCYKVFKKDVLKDLVIEENRFGVEPEITAKIGTLCRLKKISVYEVGISYFGRTYEEGKKIGIKDAFRAFWCIFKYNTSPFAVLLKFGLFSLLAAGLHFALMNFFVNFAGLKSEMGQNMVNIMGLEVSLLTGFFLHSKLTWHDRFQNTVSGLKKAAIFHGLRFPPLLIRSGLFYFLLKAGLSLNMNILAGVGASLIMGLAGYQNFKDNRLDWRSGETL